jgi:hypothetical protein
VAATTAGVRGFGGCMVNATTSATAGKQEQ